MYNAAVLDAFDFLISEMGKRGMRATVVLGDEWQWSGGHVQYLRWAQKGALRGDVGACHPLQGVPDILNASWRSRGYEDVPYTGPGLGDWGKWQALAGEFYSNAAAQKLWKAHVLFMTKHVSNYTGLAHRNEPTIMSWQLANEPRSTNLSSESAAEFVDWMATSTMFVKRCAPKQLVSSGMEGDTSYFSKSQSLMHTQGLAGVDYVTSHLWVQNWDLYVPGYDDASFLNATLAFGKAYIIGSAAQAAALGLPLVLEEFGFPRDLGSLSPLATTKRRDRFYAMCFMTLLDSVSFGGSLAGMNWWAYSGVNRPAARDVPATTAELCNASGVSLANNMTLVGNGTDWSTCFINQGQRPATCGVSTWWAVRSAWPQAAFDGQDAVLGDPPHESQGWYSVYDVDTTMAVVKKYSARLAAVLACVNASISTGVLGCMTALPVGNASALCM